MDIDYNPKYSSLIINKWVSTVASIWIQSTAGSAYTFAIYSQALKTSQHYNQSTLNTVSFFKDCGANIGILAGLLYSAVTTTTTHNHNNNSRRRRPWVVVFCGSLLCFIGYFLIWLSVVGFLTNPPVWLMGVYILLAAQSATFFNTANVVTAVHNFPSYRGISVGIMKGFLGLSGAILVQVYHTLLKDKPVMFILMLALFPSISSLLLMWFVRIFPALYIDDKKRLNSLSLVTVFIALYLMAVILIQNIVVIQLVIRIAAFVILIVLLIVLPLSVAMKAENDQSQGLLASLLEHNQSIYEGNRLVSSVEGHVEAGDGMNVFDSMQETGENVNLLKAMCSVNFWFLFLTSVSGMGSGLAMINNMSQIGESLGHSSLETSTLISLWSIWNFFGRFGGGFVSDYFLHRKGLSRPLSITITLAVMSVGHALIALGFSSALYFGSVLVGVCYGSQWSLMPIVASEIFGSKHMGPIFNTISVASPVGTYLLSVTLVGKLYDKEASGSERTCYGTHCFRLSFLIMACTTLLGSLVGLCLFFRTRNFYKQVIIPRLKTPRDELE